jgi:hypothetical protein
VALVAAAEDVRIVAKPEDPASATEAASSDVATTGEESA